MKASVLALLLVAGLTPLAVPVQAPRDTPPPAFQHAVRERELRALVASGGATRDTYIELSNLDIFLNRIDDAVAALDSAAQLEPNVPETQHMLATIAWQHANRDVTDPVGRQSFIREGIALEGRALSVKPDYTDAMTYKNILLRMLANLTDDPVEKGRLITEADALRNRVMEIQTAAAASFSGFAEAFDQTYARLTPVRAGGGIPQPTKTHDAKPVYPDAARSQRVQGVVIIEAIIDPSGSIANARVLRSIPLLDQAALSAVSQWQFTPTLVNGVPAAVMMTVTVNFTLQSE